MTYGRIFGRQGVHGAPTVDPAPRYDFTSRYLYPGAWLNVWQVKHRKNAAEIAAIVGVTEAEIDAALRARNAPHAWKSPIAAYHRRKRRWRDLHNARARLLERHK